MACCSWHDVNSTDRGRTTVKGGKMIESLSFDSTRCESVLFCRKSRCVECGISRSLGTWVREGCQEWYANPVAKISGRRTKPGVLRDPGESTDTLSKHSGEC